MSGNSLSRGNPRPQPDVTNLYNPDFYKNWAAASAQGLLNMSGNSLSRGHPRPQPDATSYRSYMSFTFWSQMKTYLPDEKVLTLRLSN